MSNFSSVLSSYSTTTELFSSYDEYAPIDTHNAVTAPLLSSIRSSNCYANSVVLAASNAFRNPDLRAAQELSEASLESEGDETVTSLSVLNDEGSVPPPFDTESENDF